MDLLQKHFDIALETPDGIKKLRSLILTLAMQGKLVAQDSKDQSAKELLEIIQKEQNGVAKNGKNKRSDDILPIDSKDLPFKLPKTSQWVRLGEIAEVLMGQSPDGKTYNDRGAGVPLVNGPVEFGGKEPFAETLAIKFTTSPTKMCSKGDLLLCVRGSTTGRTNIAGFDSCIGRGVAALRPHIDRFYFNYFVLGHRQNLFDSGTGSTFPNISQDKILNILFPLPPLAEQTRIVAKIDQLMALCDKLEAERNARDQKRITVQTAAMNRLLSAPDKPSFDSSWQFITKHFTELYSVTPNVAELKKAILQLAVMGKLVRQDPNDQPASELLKQIEAEKARLEKEGKIKKQVALPEITAEEVPYALPSGWAWTRLGQLTEPGYWLSYGVLVPGNHDPSGVPFVRVQDLDTAYLGKLPEKKISNALDNQYKRTKLVGNEILICVVGSIGKVALSPREWIGANIARAVCRYMPNKDLSRDYLYDVLIAPRVQKYFQDEYHSINPTLNIGKLELTLIPVPPLAEQQRIVAKIDQLMALCDALEKQIGAATEKKTAILNAVLAIRPATPAGV